MAKPAVTRTIRLTVEITVNAEDWMEAFGVARRDLPEDVREYFTGMIRDSAILTNGEISDAHVERLN